ncbi:MAG: hypothetical protein AAF460_02440 [Pseudomonadota bacterium]
MNSRGLKMRDVERPLTDAERAEQARQAELEAEVAKYREQEALADRELIEAFPSLTALDQARDFRLSTLDQKIRYFASRRADAADKLGLNHDRIRNFQRKKLKVPEQLVIEKIKLDRDIQALGQRIASNELERAKVEAEFAAHRARYLRILAERKVQALGN